MIRSLEIAGGSQREGIVVKRFRVRGGLAALPLDRQSLVVKSPGCWMVDLPPGNAAGSRQRLAASRVGLVAGRHGQDLVEPSPAFGQMSVLVPESPQRARGLLRQLGLASVHSPPKRPAHIAVLPFQSAEPLTLVHTGQVSLSLESKLEKVLAVALAHKVQFAGGRELLLPELANRLQHRKPRMTVGFVSPNQGLIPQ